MNFRTVRHVNTVYSSALIEQINPLGKKKYPAKEHGISSTQKKGCGGVNSP